MKLAACRRLEEVLVQRDANRDATRDALMTASLQQHLQSCQDCRRHQQTWAWVQQRALAANDVLDDLTSARVFGRVRARLDWEAAQQGKPAVPQDRSEQRTERRTRPRHARFGWSLAFAAVTILAFVLGTRLHRQEPSLVMAPMALEPYAMQVLAEPRSTVLAKGLEHLALPPHASMRARLGRAADLTLLGPLELTVRDGEKQRVELDLRSGTLLADFDGSGGRSLRISTPDATVDIVGTRFIVDATAARTRVAVDHGRVRVESKGRVRMVGSGFSWSTDQDALTPLDGELARMFHTEALEASREEVTTGSAVGDDEERASRGERKGGNDRKSRGDRKSRAEGKIRAEGNSRGTARGNVAGKSRPEGPARVAPPARMMASRSTTSSLPSLPATPGASREDAVATVAPKLSAAPPVTAAPPSEPPAPTPAPSVPLVHPAPPRTTVSSLYKEAEAALRRGDDAAGKERLAELVSSFPRDVMADSARFELALLAHKDGKRREALAQLRKILSHGTSGPFVEPASFLRCRVYLEENREAAETCLARFVRDYPQSPHDDVAVRALIDLSRAKGQCSKASSFAEMYLQRHPTGPFADEAAQVRSHCAQ